MKPTLTLSAILFLLLSLNSAKPEPGVIPSDAGTAIMVKRIVPIPPGLIKFVWAGTIRDKGNC